ncbi:MAG: heterodisulfide reductase subunit MvhD [Candidatus Schekmanbacteria bacterium RIFCSPHIGHO2_02_FULL_38_11]|nr:MAG: heterodisulfide reductase subunit MvhD [Candidatus Schekmanbacteria bacterium GWA2_38_9]OGL48650.1 MAG: heterodisulfide reductase subunit MvhD [Candidatus Schekmanbacteria bacterium RIFCSPHIGHO2_02_FULL_38_11]
MDKKSFNPKIITFCCNHSAYEAADLAGKMKIPYPEGINIIRVPCSGKVDVYHILKAFEKGADGVLVLACYEDNCKYLHGNIRAKKRIDYIKNLLEEIGIEKERVEIYNLASNTGHRFVNLVRRMNDKVVELGPLMRNEKF